MIFEPTSCRRQWGRCKIKIQLQLHELHRWSLSRPSIASKEDYTGGEQTEGKRSGERDDQVEPGKCFKHFILILFLILILALMVIVTCTPPQQAGPEQSGRSPWAKSPSAPSFPEDKMWLWQRLGWTHRNDDVDDDCEDASTCHPSVRPLGRVCDGTGEDDHVNEDFDNEVIYRSWWWLRWD